MHEPPPDPEALLQRGFRYALALTHDRASAEDLVHDAWLRVQGRRQAGSIAYLVTTIRNRWIDQERRRTVVSMVPLEVEVRGPDTTVDRRLALRDEVGRALATLTADERECLYLNAVEGWTAEEIGRLVGRPRNTILTVMARARRRLAAWRSEQPDLEVL